MGIGKFGSAFSVFERTLIGIARLGNALSILENMIYKNCEVWQ